jgi:hypothetical protein
MVVSAVEVVARVDPYGMCVVGRLCGRSRR